MPRPTRRAAVGNLLDPRLAEQNQAIKLEQSVSPSPAPQLAGPMVRHRNTYAAHMQFFPADSRASSHSYTNPDYETSSEYSDPGERRRYHTTAAASCAVEDDHTLGADSMAVSEATKLKGVYWPGMDIFDSATPEMRRKRNQKKDRSVVKQLEQNSKEVEAIELIFSPEGSFKRQRRISCSESDDDADFDIKLESPDLARRRPTFAYMDPNIRPQKQGKGAAVTYTGHALYEDHGPSRYRLTHDTRVSRRKRLRVFHDEEDDHVSFSQPTRMSYLTAGFTHPQSQSAVPVTSGYKPLSDPFSFENKENAHPLFHPGVLGNPHGQPNNNYHYAAYMQGPGHDFGYGYAHGHGHGNGFDPTGLLNNYMFTMPHDEDDDEQRTITAPPSPSTE